MGSRKTGWFIIGGFVFALVIIPFLIWGDRIDAWTMEFVSSAGRNFLLVALVLGGLLAFDIILPVPSSIVSTSCGLLLGFFPGLLVSLGGMIISCVVGYWIGFMLGRPAAVRLVGEDGLDRFGRISDRYGIWAIVIARPVPVLPA